jgi:hypothetical protein
MDAIASAITGSTLNRKIEMIPKSLFLLMIAPDFLVLIAYLVLFWQLISVFHQAHANLFKMFLQGYGKYLVLGAAIVLTVL